jgi:hypothetical protein
MTSFRIHYEDRKIETARFSPPPLLRSGRRRRLGRRAAHPAHLRAPRSRKPRVCIQEESCTSTHRTGLLRTPRTRRTLGTGPGTPRQGLQSPLSQSRPRGRAPLRRTGSRRYRRARPREARRHPHPEANSLEEAHMRTLCSPCRRRGRRRSNRRNPPGTPTPESSWRCCPRMGLAPRLETSRLHTQRGAKYWKALR